MKFLIKEIKHEMGFFHQDYSVGDTVTRETLLLRGFEFKTIYAKDIIKGMAVIVTLELIEEDNMFGIKNEDTGNRATIIMLRTELKDLRRMLKEKTVKNNATAIAFATYRIDNPEKGPNVFELGAEILLVQAKHELKAKEKLMGDLVKLNYEIKNENRNLKRENERLKKLLEERSGTVGGC